MSSPSDSDCLTACNPIRTLAFLVRELKEVATDQRFVIILGEMEKTLPRIAAVSKDLLVYFHHHRSQSD